MQNVVLYITCDKNLKHQSTWLVHIMFTLINFAESCHINVLQDTQVNINKPCMYTCYLSYITGLIKTIFTTIIDVW